MLVYGLLSQYLNPAVLTICFIVLFCLCQNDKKTIKNPWGSLIFEIVFLIFEMQIVPNIYDSLLFLLDHQE